MPLFDANFTDGEGVRGRLGPLGSDVEIGLTETEPLGVAEGVRAQAGPSRKRDRVATRRWF